MDTNPNPSDNFTSINNTCSTTWGLMGLAMENDNHHRHHDHHFINDQFPYESIWPSHHPPPPATGFFSSWHHQSAPNSHILEEEERVVEEEDEEEEEEELGAMKEMMYNMAAMQPVDIDPATVRRPKRRNVRISDDPQSVAARLRREKISEKIRILQRLVPGGTKMDTASMLDEAVRYVKYLKRQIRRLQVQYSNNNSNNNNNIQLRTSQMLCTDTIKTTMTTMAAVGQPEATISEEWLPPLVVTSNNNLISTITTPSSSTQYLQGGSGMFTFGGRRGNHDSDY